MKTRGINTILGRKTFSYFFVMFFVFSFFILPVISFSAETTGYTLLTPLPLGPGGSRLEVVPLGEASFGDYLNNFFKLGITIASILAVIMIVIGGVQYMGGDSVFSKEEAKSKMTNSIFGLILALGIWLLLYTINPDMLNLKLKIAEIAPTPATPTTPLPTTPTCYDCVEIPGQYGVPTKTPGACSGSGPCKVKSNLANSLMLLNNSLSLKNIGWQVTEAWPPTGYSESKPNGIHASSCHGNATCVDANFLPNTAATPENIDKFCSSVKLHLGSVMYEVPNKAAFDALQGKIPNCILRNTGSPPHFHFPI